MTYHQKIGIGLFSVIFLILLAGSFIYMKYKGVSASELESRGNVVWQNSLSRDFDSDGKIEKVTVTAYANGNTRRSFISTDRNILSKREKELIGFEEDLAFCPIKDFAAGGDSVICVFGEVGAHSQNVQMVRWSDFSFLSFIGQTGEEQPNISCDVPNFDLSYVTKDKLKIYFDNRDYDKNPLVDIVRTHYYLDNISFRYDGVERIANEGLIK